MKLVMFDIDGTLTRTYAVDGECFVQALRDVFGFTGISDDWSIYPHCTDSGILDFLFQERMGRAPNAAEVDACQRRFVSLLEAEAAVRRFQPIAGAGEIIQRLLSTSGVAISLASGGWKCSAQLKLASAGLDVSQLPGAFADDAHAREEIMRISLTRSSQAHSQSGFDSVVYVGDGIWDARASRNLGWRCIGIASDPLKAERLRSAGALEVFPNFADAEAFLAAI